MLFFDMSGFLSNHFFHLVLAATFFLDFFLKFFHLFSQVYILNSSWFTVFCDVCFGGGLWFGFVLHMSPQPEMSVNMDH